MKIKSLITNRYFLAAFYIFCTSLIFHYNYGLTFHLLIAILLSSNMIIWILLHNWLKKSSFAQTALWIIALLLTNFLLYIPTVISNNFKNMLLNYTIANFITILTYNQLNISAYNIGLINALLLIILINYHWTNWLPFYIFIISLIYSGFILDTKTEKNNKLSFILGMSVAIILQLL